MRIGRILFALMVLVCAWRASHAQGAPLPQAVDTSALSSAIAALQANQAESFDVTLDANGNGVVAFSPLFAAPPRIAYFPQNPSTAGSQIGCNWQTRSASQLTFHCDRSGIMSLLQVPFNPFGNPAAGAMVTIVARGTIAQ